MPAPAEHYDALYEALVEVAESSYFAYAEPCDRPRFEEAVAGVPPTGEATPAAWLKARVAFEGAFAGDVELTLPFDLARQLLVSFGGLSPDDEVPDGYVIDSTGEFANMVCGAWLTRACNRRRFDLRPPAVVGLEQPPAATGDRLVLLNEQPVEVALRFARG